MGKYRFVVDTDLCINCKACDNACREKNDTAEGIYLGKISYRNENDVLNIRFLACPQCNNAKCVSACPTGALVCRAADGTVYVDSDKCISGCTLCQEACPHAKVWTDPRTGKAVKCDLCYDRMDMNLQPACIENCPTSALKLVERVPGVSLHDYHKHNKDLVKS